MSESNPYLIRADEVQIPRIAREFSQLHNESLGNLRLEDVRNVMARFAVNDITAANNTPLTDFSLSDGSRVHQERDKDGNLVHLVVIEPDGGGYTSEIPNTLSHGIREYEVDPRSHEIVAGAIYNRVGTGFALINESGLEVDQRTNDSTLTSQIINFTPEGLAKIYGGPDEYELNEQFQYRRKR